MTATRTATHAQRNAAYRTWLATSAKLRAEGDVAAYFTWFVENPSPAAASGGAIPNLNKQRERAAFAVGCHFAAKTVQVHYREDDTGTDTDNGPAVWMATGEILGIGFIQAGAASADALMIRNEFGRIVAIATSEITAIENA